MSDLVVSEVFGPTIQGEGPATGRLASFVRLGGCNLTCTWCDAAYTWDAGRFNLREELTRQPVDLVLERVLATNAALKMVVITGGEPLLQAKDSYGLVELVTALTDRNIEVHVETNGTVAPAPELRRHVTLFAVSPKLPHAGMPQRVTIVPEVLGQFAVLALAGRAFLKVVVKTIDDVHRAARIADHNGWPRSAVWVMPEGTDAMAVCSGHRRLINVTLSLGLNMTTRLHILAYGNERGT